MLELTLTTEPNQSLSLQFNSLSDSEKQSFLETLNPEQLEHFIQDLKQDEYSQQSRETELTNIEKRRLASADANRRRRESEATVVIPWLTDAERQRRGKLEADNEAFMKQVEAAEGWTGQKVDEIAQRYSDKLATQIVSTAQRGKTILEQRAKEAEVAELAAKTVFVSVKA